MRRYVPKLIRLPDLPADAILSGLFAHKEVQQVCAGKQTGNNLGILRNWRNLHLRFRQAHSACVLVGSGEPA